MICKLLRTIELLDELQYWIDIWTPFNNEKRFRNFDRISHELYLLGDYESMDVANKARERSIFLPFKGKQIYGGEFYNPNLPSLLKTIMVTP